MARPLLIAAVLAGAPVLGAGCAGAGVGAGVDAGVGAAANAEMVAAARPEPASEMASEQAPKPVRTSALDPAWVQRGEDAYFRCKGCHSIAKGAPSSAGPNLYAVIGRRAGRYPGYPFSDALAQSGVVWDAQSLDAFLADPSGYIPGSEMRRGTVREAETRAAIIAYLAAQSD
ncbi:MAG: c-type cytochrome [Pseudomonadota bacterium]